MMGYLIYLIVAMIITFACGIAVGFRLGEEYGSDQDS